MRNESSPSRRWLWGLLAAVLLLIVVARLVAGVVADRRLEAAFAAWRDGGRDLDAIPARYPFRQETESALALEARAAVVGLRLTPRGSERLPARADSAGDSRSGGAAARHASALLRDVLAREGAAIPEPPPALAVFFEERGEAWAAVRRHLLEEAPSLWALEVEAGWEAPIPALLGLLQIHRLLLAEALLHERAGRPVEAVRSFEASWRFGAGLRARPELTSQLVSLTVASAQAAVARRLSALPADPWADRLVERDPRAGIVDALAAEARAASRLAADASLPFAKAGAPAAWRRALAALVAPLARLAVAEILDALRLFVADLEGAGACPPDPTVFERSVRQSVSDWNRLGRVVLPDLSQVAARAWHAATQLELSSKVLRARAAGGRVDEAWSRAACKDGAWELEALPGGGWRVAWRGPGGADEPLSFVWR